MRFRHADAKPEASVLSQIRDPQVYPTLNLLQEQYEQIRLYQNWSFGPAAASLSGDARLRTHTPPASPCSREGRGPQGCLAGETARIVTDQAIGKRR